MTDEHAIALGPVQARERIEVLDLMRGFAILGILFMNMPIMAKSGWVDWFDIRLGGWTKADQIAWAVNNVLLSGTQRGMLQLLFGAGMMLLAARAMQPDGPVAVFDMYQRRNMWLVLLGAIHAMVFLWPGDILFLYGITALLIFPFRVVAPRKLFIAGLSLAILFGVGGTAEYFSRTKLIATIDRVDAKVAKNQALTKEETEAQKDWKKLSDKLKIDKDQRKKLDDERKWRTGGIGAYASGLIAMWGTYLAQGMLAFGILESFFTMLIGIALFKWGVIQGNKDRAFYLRLLLACYAFAIPARILGAYEQMQFDLAPKTMWITNEFARLAMAIGHIALINWLAKTRFGLALLAPFRATGKTALSLYIMQSIITMWILFAPFGFGLWDKFGYAMQIPVVLAIVVFQLIVANIWVRHFAMGPFEWVWRSLAYWKRQPFRLPKTDAAKGEAVVAA